MAENEVELAYLREENQRLTAQRFANVEKIRLLRDEIHQLQVGLAREWTISELRRRNADLEGRVRALMSLNARLMKADQQERQKA